MDKLTNASNAFNTQNISDMSTIRSIYRTHTCGILSKKDINTEITLSGWIHRKRDHGGILFIDLRDHYGITQLVTSNKEERLSKLSNDLYEKIDNLSNESVITIKGIVVARSIDTINKDLSTGDIEVIINDFSIHSVSELLPLQINSDQEFPEDTRLRYRFLDLRREKLHNNIILRNHVIRYLREKMHALGFMEFQTPILTASSPEGARDFLVPSRVHPGKFYALPQAPQQFKQLLMVAGFDRYFQIAPCFRDEDARADRAPGEFYQLDLEMSFVTQEDVFRIMEPVIGGLFNELGKKKVLQSPFPEIKYCDAMLKYGSDKPDLRNPLIIADTTEIFVNSEFTIFREAIKKGAVIRAIPAPNTSEEPRSFFDKMIAFAQTELNAKGLAYITFDKDGVAKGPIAKLINTEQLNMLKEVCKLKDGDTVFFACENELNAAKIAGKVREKLGIDLNLIDKNIFAFCWIVDFPYYEYNEDEKKIDFSHNPFSMPQGGLNALLNANTLEKRLSIKAYQYDIVCNGIELSSGAIRNHDVDLMYKAFEIAGYDKKFVDDKFSAMINAFRYGVPPHGGFAPGIDRMVMLLADEFNIREVIAFPLNQKAQDLMMNAPNYVTDKQLNELHIKIKEKK